MQPRKRSAVVPRSRQCDAVTAQETGLKKKRGGDTESLLETKVKLIDAVLLLKISDMH